MRDIINELFVKMSRFVTQYDNFKRFIPFKYRRFILYIAIFTVITLGIKYYFNVYYCSNTCGSCGYCFFYIF